MSPIPPPTPTPCTKYYWLSIWRWNCASLGGDAFSCLLIFTPPTYETLDGVGGDSLCIWINTTTVRIQLGYDIDEKSPPATGLCQVTSWNQPDIVDTGISDATHLGGCEDSEEVITLAMYYHIKIQAVK